MAIAAQSLVHVESVYAILATVGTALFSVKPLAAIGRASILSWVDEDTAQHLNRLPIVCWFAAPLVALLLCVAVLPQFRPGELTEIVAMSMITGLLAALLTNLTRIDTLCRLLPDPLTGLLIASGLIARAFDLPPIGVSLTDALIGSLLGYGLLWWIAWLFRKFRDINAMGRGDFAMSAGLGAWLGWQSIPMVWMIASLAGILFALLRKQYRPPLHPGTRSESPKPLLSTEIPFGPALALGAIATWVQLG